MQSNSKSGKRLAAVSANKQLIMAYGVMVLILILAELVSPGFLALSHLDSIMRQICFLAIVGIGQTYAIITGGIDLSVASVIALSNVVSAQIMSGQDENVLPAILAVLAIGLFAGLANGAGVQYLKISPLVMTLAMGSVMQGAAYIYCKGAPKGATAPFVRNLAVGKLFGLSLPFLIWLVLAAVFVVVLKCTTAGRAVYAVGTNQEAARQSGVHTSRTIIGVYVLSGIMSALVGFLLIGYTGTSFLNTGEPYTMNSIAAVVIGGTSVAGGSGGYIGTIAGAVIMTVLVSILTVAKIPEFGRQMAQGIIILVILLVYGRERKKR